MKQSTDIVYDVDLKEIYSDDEFNCRGRIAPGDVVDLSQNIQKYGLQSPIILQPFTLAPGKKFRIISGHRRYKAVTLDRDATTIKAIIRENLDEIQATVLNFSENIKRKDLNLVQQAKTCHRLVGFGWTQEEIAAELNVSRSWVAIRLKLLALPVEIQEAASADFFTQTQLKEIADLPTKQQQFDAAKSIKEAKFRGEKILKKVTKLPNPFEKKRRTTTEINKMNRLILDVIGANLATRCMAWCAGEIDNNELYKDLAYYASMAGKNFEIPKEFIPGVM